MRVERETEMESVCLWRHIESVCIEIKRECVCRGT